jgi:hypothetical protein
VLRSIRRYARGWLSRSTTFCIEHHQAAHVLVDNDVRGSAFALYRPQFEAYTRAHWYFACASDAKLEEFVHGGEPPGMRKLADDLQETLGQPGEITVGSRIKPGAPCALLHTVGQYK